MRTLMPHPPWGRKCAEPRPATTIRSCAASCRKDGAIVRGETAAVSLALPEVRIVHVEPFDLLGADVEAPGRLRDQLLAGLEPITKFPRREFAEFDASAAYLLTDRDNRHVTLPSAPS